MSCLYLTRRNKCHPNVPFEDTVGLLVGVFTCTTMLRNEIKVSSYNSSHGNITPVFTYF